MDSIGGQLQHHCLRLQQHSQRHWNPIPGGPLWVPCASATSPDSTFVGSAQGAMPGSGGTVCLDTETPVGDS